MKEQMQDYISNDLDENYKYLKNLFKDNTDMIFRKFNAGKAKCLIVYIDGMADKILLDNFVLRTLMLHGDRIEKVEDIKDEILSVTDIRDVEELSKGINAMLSGDTLMLIEGLDICYVIATRAWSARGVSEPSGESLIRGSRDGFVETIRFNTALLRRRVRDTRLRIEMTTVGARSKTDVAIVYIDDIVNKEVLECAKKRIDNINIDAILDSGYIEQLIEDNKWSIFPQLQSTERPDVVAAAIYEGRVGIMVDNSPFCIIVPTTLPALFQSPDDYYQRWIYSSVMRIVRFLGIVLSLILPGLYVAVTSFHNSIIPTKLAYAIAATREGVPFPAYLEALIMEVSMAILVEAVVRLPKAMGTTIGIVGGVIIGQAAVTAGIVSPVMVIIVSITAITTFMTPNYEIVASLRIVRFMFIIASSIIGLYGMALVALVTLIHLIKLKSFGIPYMASVVDINKNDMKDTFIRSPLQYLKQRPKYIKSKDRMRQN
ncbi:spore germination protein [Clostridium oryzae]|uniref:Spore germination protein B1 n=1 Tax=Clostridium oryzae TaxID=1450648 RepID=A0A1V4IUA8_9CLOT|nr:spore germination protein [Clostridium oryzae]OPJ63400.1 spore germination protein B1 [Clostridium oryzae]